MLELHNVCLRPDQQTGFDHTFNPGEISVVLGANQAGKTDLCRLIAGLTTPATGQVVLGGLDLTSVRVQQRPVAMVYQAFVNYPNLSVFDNIASPLKAQGVAGEALQDQVHLMAKRLQIEGLLNRLPSELSGGQQQRLAIARALAKQTQVLLLDEPLVNLDFKLREALEVELRELLHAQNMVVIYTSSDPRDAFNLGDEVLLLDDGHKLQAGTPIQVYQYPQNLKAMNLLADPQVNTFTQNAQTCAVRPEHVQLASQGVDEADQRMRFDMQVTACETSGDESFVHGLVDAQEWVMRGRGIMRVDSGEHIQVSARDADVVRF